MTVRHSILALALALPTSGCADGAPQGGVPPADDGAAPVADDDATPALPPAWDRGLPPTADVYPERRGLRELRGIVHLHSPFSHDACDGEPFPDGVFNEECLTRLRDALCTTRQDFAFLTDHPAHASDYPYQDLLEIRDGDEPVPGDDGAPIANRVGCDDGHRVLWMPGIESSDLMPVGLHRHAGADGDPGANDAVYGSLSDGAIAAVHAAGGLAFVAHAEGVTREELLAAPTLDGIEVYNLHANVDPDIREEDLGLDGFDWLEDVGPFMDDHQPEIPESDLVFLTFWAPNAPDLQHLDALLAGGRRLAVVAGTDAHENALPMPMPDGERVDSYRRMLRWFSNHVLARDDSPEAVSEALGRGRAYVAFETFGVPVGFDFVAEDAGGGIAEMGEDVAAAGTTLRATLPEVWGGWEWGPAPEVTGRLVLADGQGGTVVAEGEGPFEVTDPAPGAYRVEVDLVPRQLAPYLGGEPALAERTFTWIYSGAIYLR